MDISNLTPRKKKSDEVDVRPQCLIYEDPEAQQCIIHVVQSQNFFSILNL